MAQVRVSSRNDEGTAASCVDHPVLVTGAASGIGAAVVERLVSEGRRVIAVDRDVEGLARWDSARQAGSVVPITCDLSIDAQIESVAADLRDEALGGLVHAAGILHLEHFVDAGLDVLDRILAVNLRAPYELTRLLVEPLSRSSGPVVAVSSAAGLQGWPYAAAYAASKAGLGMLMRSLAVELAPLRIRVNIVCPGAVESPMTEALVPLDGIDQDLLKRSRSLDGRRADPREIASVIAFLLTEDASFMTGAVVPVDGGAFA